MWILGDIDNLPDLSSLSDDDDSDVIVVAAYDPWKLLSVACAPKPRAPRPVRGVLAAIVGMGAALAATLTAILALHP
jgi:hypothetical protein